MLMFVWDPEMDTWHINGLALLVTLHKHCQSYENLLAESIIVQPFNSNDQVSVI
jgi:hypothetical protein